ncbi:hypothetical protein [Risungbinella massiliensis]|uniref:hypothetical protein n=1 Tax=Risungbinella massiliensis TaxID=1329796 RepID=UPI0005CC50A1|nr:hypothetical protein [Risungbinella massiliensis]
MEETEIASLCLSLVKTAKNWESQLRQLRNQPDIPILEDLIFLAKKARQCLNRAKWEQISHEKNSLNGSISSKALSWLGTAANLYCQIRARIEEKPSSCLTKLLTSTEYQFLVRVLPDPQDGADITPDIAKTYYLAG